MSTDRHNSKDIESTGCVLLRYSVCSSHSSRATPVIASLSEHPVPCSQISIYRMHMYRVSRGTQSSLRFTPQSIPGDIPSVSWPVSIPCLLPTPHTLPNAYPSLGRALRELPSLKLARLGRKRWGRLGRSSCSLVLLSHGRCRGLGRQSCRFSRSRGR